MNKLKVLDLFSGIGGFSLGLERTGGFETVAFCEIEEYPRRVLAKHWPEVFCHRDVCTLTKETLWKGYAENAALIQLCRELRGNLASARSVIESIRENAAERTQTNTTSGPLNVDEALLNIMAGSAPAAVKKNTHFWQSITLTTTAAKNAKNINELLGKSLSREDFQAVIKFFVTTATWQKPSTEHALMKAAMGTEIYHDVTTLTADILERDGISVDVITGGFPCQDLSNAGNRAGMGEGTRSGLWSQIDRLTGELRPKIIILENVAALLSGPSEKRGAWFGRVLGDLAKRGYDAEWQNIPAAAMGAPHLRERAWVVAYPQKERQSEARQLQCGDIAKWLPSGGETDFLAYDREERTEGRKPQEVSGFSAFSWCKDVRRVEDFRELPDLPPPLFRGSIDGVPNWVDRVGACGNAVVPQIPEMIGHAILQAEAAA